MRCLFLILFILASCGKQSNEVSPKATADIFDSKYEELFFSTDTHEREIFLNALIESKLNQEEISVEKLYRLNSKLRSYEQQNVRALAYKEENFAKLYVSYEDKVSIYFLPEKVDLKILEGELNLPTIPGNVYTWAKRKGDFSKKGDLLILVNTNLDEVIQNDKKFYVEKIELNNQLTGLNVNNGMKIKLKIETNYLIQSLTPVRKEKMRAATNKHFYRDCNEAGSCHCAYTINQVSNSMGSYTVDNGLQMRFQITIGNKIIKSQDLKLVLSEVNKLETEFDIEEENEYSSVHFTNLLSNVQEQVTAYNPQDSACANVTEVINRKVIANERVVMEKWGRGYLGLMKIKL